MAASNSAKALTRFTAAGLSVATCPGSRITSMTGWPAARAWATNRLMVVWPIPRVGVLIARSNETSSIGIEQYVGYTPDTSLISLRL
jgi:hypothetical protein